MFLYAFYGFKFNDTIIQRFNDIMKEVANY